MIEIASFAAIFLLPVAVLLFLTRMRLPRVEYPHFLLSSSLRKGFSGRIARFFRTWYDSLFDTAIGLVLAIVLAAPALEEKNPFLAARKAVVIDLSLSMLDGPFGGRLLDRALRTVMGDGKYRGYRVFGLVFDSEAMKTRLVPLEGFVKGGVADTAAVRIASSFDFFSVDCRVLGELRDRGFGRITFLTDSFNAPHDGFDLVELDKDETNGRTLDPPVTARSWPASARYERAEEIWVIDMVDAGISPVITLSFFYEGAFVPVDPAIVRMESLPGGSRIVLGESGLYLVTLRDGKGGSEGFPILLHEARHTVSVSGAFSRSMASSFPLLVESTSPEIILEDEVSTGTTKNSIIRTTVRNSDCPLIMNPPSTGACLVAAAYAPGYDFALGPASIASDCLVLAYDAAIQSLIGGSYLSSVPAKATSLVPAGRYWLARTEKGSMPLLPDPSEFFPDLPDPALILEAPSPWKREAFVVLFVLLAGKIITAALLAGKPGLKRYRKEEDSRELHTRDKRPTETI